MPGSAVAAVDLGSNSFHLVVARIQDGEVQIIDKLRERVQLAAGLDERDHLSEAALMRALDCLKRFGQRLASFGPDRVRAVGTNTLRRASNSDVVLALAEAALGHPIETISGQEEARLIYLGVTHGQDDGGQRRLVVDIGGGSTECIVGTGPEIEQSDSLEMGCVSYSRRFFPDGRITADRIQKAFIAARLELSPVHRIYRGLGWSVAHGSSGTINAIRTMLLASGWSDLGITSDGLEHLEDALVDAGHVDALDIPALSPDRRAVLPGGYAVLKALFRSLRIDELQAAKGALREGVLFDLIGRGGSEDVRDRTVDRLQARFGVDVAQAARVRQVAMQLFEQALPGMDVDRSRATLYLGWAAALHEVGKAIAYSGHHRHGAYLVKNTEMPGFSYRDHALLAALVLTHRRKIDRQAILDLGCAELELVLRLALPLRLSVCLNRTRSPSRQPPASLSLEKNTCTLQFPAGWLDERPLTRADLDEEARLLGQVGVALVVT
ncbi:MAG: Ppx/GppA phosphatase family protein [bacterium]